VGIRELRWWEVFGGEGFGECRAHDIGVWWRAMFPMELGTGLLVWGGGLDFTLVNLAALPFLVFLMNWAGKVVARKNYGFMVIAIPMIGWSIFWRAMLASMPLRFFYLLLSSYSVVSGVCLKILLQHLQEFCSIQSS